MIREKLSEMTNAQIVCTSERESVIYKALSSPCSIASAFIFADFFSFTQRNEHETTK